MLFQLPCAVLNHPDCNLLQPSEETSISTQEGHQGLNVNIPAAVSPPLLAAMPPCLSLKPCWFYDLLSSSFPEEEIIRDAAVCMQEHVLGPWLHRCEGVREGAQNWSALNGLIIGSQGRGRSQASLAHARLLLPCSTKPDKLSLRFQSTPSFQSYLLLSLPSQV